ncbi:hypothetical protein B0H14DRAFT_3865945 [Mycena olivaceomarginata]|nr:hypothetical protein B0H14DRAFT_3865945 [Mycena olivaceomarginata]
MDELAALLAHIPEAVLSLYKEKSFPVGFRTKNPAFFVGTDWVDLGDLQTWLGGQDQFRHYLVGLVAAPVLQTDILDLESLYRTADDYLDLFFTNTSGHCSSFSSLCPKAKSIPQTADARTEPPAVEKSREKRKLKPWSVQHADGLTYTSFEFRSLFPTEYLELHGDAEPA